MMVGLQRIYGQIYDQTNTSGPSWAIIQCNGVHRHCLTSWACWQSAARASLALACSAAFAAEQAASRCCHTLCRAPRRSRSCRCQRLRRRLCACKLRHQLGSSDATQNSHSEGMQQAHRVNRLVAAFQHFLVWYSSWHSMMFGHIWTLSGSDVPNPACCSCSQQGSTLCRHSMQQALEHMCLAYLLRKLPSLQVSLSLPSASRTAGCQPSRLVPSVLLLQRGLVSRLMLLDTRYHSPIEWGHGNKASCLRPMMRRYGDECWELGLRGGCAAGAASCHPAAACPAAGL